MPAGWDWVRWGCGEWQRNFLSPQYAIVMWWLVKICQASLLVSAIVCQLELSLSRVGTLGQKLAPVGLKKKKKQAGLWQVEGEVAKIGRDGGRWGREVCTCFVNDADTVAQLWFRMFLAKWGSMQLSADQISYSCSFFFFFNMKCCG